MPQTVYYSVLQIVHTASLWLLRHGSRVQSVFRFSFSFCQLSCTSCHTNFTYSCSSLSNVNWFTQLSSHCNISICLSRYRTTCFLHHPTDKDLNYITPVRTITLLWWFIKLLPTFFLPFLLVLLSVLQHSHSTLRRYANQYPGPTQSQTICSQNICILNFGSFILYATLKFVHLLKPTTFMPFLSLKLGFLPTTTATHSQ